VVRRAAVQKLQKRREGGLVESVRERERERKEEG
jgi:hypothetical protein